MADKSLTEKWLDGTLTEDERVRFEHSLEYLSIQRLMHNLKALRAPDFNDQGAYQQLLLNKSPKPNTKVVALYWLKPALRLAAALVIGLSVYFFFISDRTVLLETPVAQQLEYQLPDLSDVTLNAASTLSFGERGWNSERQVALKGEAYFRVAKGSTFDVITDHGTIQVLGTQFNVKVREHFFEVSCYEGSVQVITSLQNTVLKPGETIRMIKGKWIEKQRIADTSPAWLAHESAFISVPVAEVLAEFERQYQINVIDKQVPMDRLFTGRFTHKNIDLALQAITIPIGLTYQLDEATKTVLLSPRVAP